MIRVLHILETISSGGVERRKLSLSKLLDKKKYKLLIICTHEKGNIPQEIRNNGVEIISIGTFKHPLHWKQHRKVQKIIESFKPHIIHGSVFEGITMALINGLITRVPVIILEETSDPQNRSWKGNFLMKCFSVFATKIIGVSPAAVNYLQETLNISHSKIRLINNGVAIPRIISKRERLNLKQSLGINEDELVIGSVGRMLDDKHKRFSDLFLAFSKLKEYHLKIKLVIVGEGPEQIKYESMCERLNVNGSVIFTGYTSDVDLYYSVFDIFCLVSAYEAFGLVLAEAMLHRLPVLATRVGGMKYIVDDGKTGILVEKYSVNEITEGLKKLCENESLRHSMGEQGYQKAILEYTEERYVADVENLYIELLQKKGILKNA